MGLAILAVIWLITFVSTYFFIAKPWWSARRFNRGGVH